MAWESSAVEVEVGSDVEDEGEGVGGFRTVCSGGVRNDQVEKGIGAGMKGERMEEGDCSWLGFGV